MPVVASVVRRNPAATVLLKFGGRATRAQLLAHTTRHHVAAALASGEVVRAARGIYVTRSLPDPEAAAARARGVLSHTTAAERRGLAMVHPPDQVHVTIPAGPTRRGSTASRTTAARWLPARPSGR